MKRRNNSAKSVATATAVVNPAPVKVENTTMRRKNKSVASAPAPVAPAPEPTPVSRPISEDDTPIKGDSIIAQVADPYTPPSSINKQVAQLWVFANQVWPWWEAQGQFALNNGLFRERCAAAYTAMSGLTCEARWLMGWTPGAAYSKQPDVKFGSDASRLDEVLTAEAEVAPVDTPTAQAAAQTAKAENKKAKAEKPKSKSEKPSTPPAFADRRALQAALKNAREALGPLQFPGEMLPRGLNSKSEALQECFAKCVELGYGGSLPTITQVAKAKVAEQATKVIKDLVDPDTLSQFIKDAPNPGSKGAYKAMQAWLKSARDVHGVELECRLAGKGAGTEALKAEVLRVTALLKGQATRKAKNSK